MILDQTNIALNLIQSSAERCYRATGKKCGQVLISKEMRASMDDDIAGIFNDMLIVDHRLKGFSCVALAEESE